MSNIVVFIKSGTSYTIPGDFGSLVSIEAIGPGYDGASGTFCICSGAFGGAGGPGGAWAKIISLTGIAAGNNYTVQIGGRASGTDTFFKDTSTLLAKAASLGSPGSSASSVGSSKQSGGIRGTAGGTALGGGGGGAGGPSGDGAAGTNASSTVGGVGGSGDNGSGGAGGAGGTASGNPAAGSDGHEYTQTSNSELAGSGGGGGGSGLFGTGTGANAGKYGAGGGGGAVIASTPDPGGLGSDGIIIFTYTAAAGGFTPIISHEQVSSRDYPKKHQKSFLEVNFPFKDITPSTQGPLGWSNPIDFLRSRPKQWIDIPAELVGFTLPAVLTGPLPYSFPIDVHRPSRRYHFDVNQASLATVQPLLATLLQSNALEIPFPSRKQFLWSETWTYVPPFVPTVIWSTWDAEEHKVNHHVTSDYVAQVLAKPYTQPTGWVSLTETLPRRNPKHFNDVIQVTTAATVFIGRQNNFAVFIG